jgi:hypothetical protein
MTSVKIMKKSEFVGEEGKVGSLLMPSDYWDATFHCDTRKIRKAVPELKGLKILRILLMTDNHPNFKHIINKKISFKYALCCSADAEGAYYNSRGEYVYENPVGDVIIIVKD